LTKFKPPEKIIPTTPSKVTSNNEYPTSNDGFAKVQSDIQHSTRNTAVNFQSDIQQSNTNSVPTSTLTRAAQPAEAEISTSEVLALDILSTITQNGTENAPATERPPEAKAEEPEIKKEDEGPKSEVTVNAEPEIKKEEVTSLESTIHNNVITDKEGQGKINENPATAPETQSTTEESQFAINEKRVTNKENPSTLLSPELKAGYQNLFLIYYNRAPIIDVNDINVAIRQAEVLIRVAELYGSIPAVRPYLGHCMMQFGRDVYTAILQDPPRWLQLSLYLESTPIFKEAVIHIIGNFPSWPWSTVQLRDFPEDIRGPGGLFERKLDDLRNLKGSIDRILLMSTIRIGGEEIPLIPKDKKTTNTWFVIQLWRDCKYLGRNPFPILDS
jgi:hypothetical protein